MKIVPVADIPIAQIVAETPLAIMKVCMQMIEVCISQDGAGLAAVQVGVPWKLFMTSFEQKFDFYLNCKYEGSGEKIKTIEGCLSLKNTSGDFRSFEVERYPNVHVTGQKLVNGKIVDFDENISGRLAIVVQHEIDHVGNGDQAQVLISEIGKEVDIF